VRACRDPLLFLGCDLGYCGCEEQCIAELCLNAATLTPCTTQTCRLGPGCGNRGPRSQGAVAAFGAGAKGLGVKTTRPLCTGDIVGRVRYSTLLKDKHKVIRLKGKWGKVQLLGKGALVNHACEPNCALQQLESPFGMPRLQLVALRPMRRGEEITYDYGNERRPFECLCHVCVLCRE
jgi:hypothetical protein